jgi:O-acetyl-ADP-ribose deacetylase (regulator of RNase III)
MLKISSREAEGWLRDEDIENFPGIDLLTIDKLWVKYSKKRFGFSVQKKIWQRVGGTGNADFKIYRSFSKRLGWGDGGNSWLYYSDLTFNSTAPVGHLPGGLLDWLWSSYRHSRLYLWSSSKPSQLNFRDESFDSAALHVWWNIISAIASRLEECNKPSPTSTTVTRQQLVNTSTNESEEGFLGEFLVRDKLVKIYQGDITNLVTDVIVSSDDNYLTMGGGVSARIRQVGGEKIYRQTENLIPLSLGEVAVTTAGKLRARKLFHAVVIDFYEGEKLSDKVIQSVVHSCMKKASLYDFKSIAFPLLGTGAAGFPAKVVWEIMFRQIIRDLSAENQNISEVIVAIYERVIVEELKIKNFLEAIEEFGWKSLL